MNGREYAGVLADSMVLGLGCLFFAGFAFGAGTLGLIWLIVWLCS